MEVRDDHYYEGRSSVPSDVELLGLPTRRWVEGAAAGGVPLDVVVQLRSGLGMVGGDGFGAERVRRRHVMLGAVGGDPGE